MASGCHIGQCSSRRKQCIQPLASWISCPNVLFLGKSTPLIAQFGLSVSPSRRPQGGCDAGYPAILSGALGLPGEVNTTATGHCSPACSFLPRSAQPFTPRPVPGSKRVISGNLKTILRRTTWVIPAQAAAPKPEAPQPCFAFLRMVVHCVSTREP